MSCYAAGSVNSNKDYIGVVRNNANILQKLIIHATEYVAVTVYSADDTEFSKYAVMEQGVVLNSSL
jgi:hypothetical protein